MISNLDESGLGQTQKLVFPKGMLPFLVEF